MSSEVFSTAYLEAKRKMQMAKQLRKSIANAAESIRKISASIDNANRILREQGSALSREIAGQGTVSSVDIKLREAATGQEDISGFTREEISKLAEQVKKNTELLYVKGTVKKETDEEVETVSVGAGDYETTDAKETTGFVKTEVSVQQDEGTPEKRKIIPQAPPRGTRGILIQKLKKQKTKN